MSSQTTNLSGCQSSYHVDCCAFLTKSRSGTRATVSSVLQYLYRYFSNTSRVDGWKNNVSHNLFPSLLSTSAIKISIIVILLIIFLMLLQLEKESNCIENLIFNFFQDSVVNALIVYKIATKKNIKIRRFQRIQRIISYKIIRII